MERKQGSRTKSHDELERFTIIYEGHLGGCAIEGDGATYYPKMWTHIVNKFNIKSVIDIGCGVGHSADYFLDDLKCEVLGVEGSVSAVEKSLIPQTMLKQHDYERNGAFIPEKNYDLAWTCFPAGTLISGSNKPIEQIEIGDIVFNKHGKEQKVLNTFKKNYTGDMLTLKISNLPNTKTTAEHPVLISNLRRIHRKNNLYHGKNEYEFIAENTEWKEARYVKKGDWVVLPYDRSYENNQILEYSFGNQKEIKKFEVDEDFAWFLGLYVAEGHTTYGKNGGGCAILSLGIHEEQLAKKSVRILNKVGIQSSYTFRKSRNGITVCSSVKSFSKLLDDLCGRKAKNKIVPTCIKKSNNEIIKSFVSGLVDGDGCLRSYSNNKKEKYLSIVSISKKLMYDVLELLHKLDVHAALFNPVDKGTVIIREKEYVAQPAYTIFWSKRSWDKKDTENGKMSYGRGKFINGNVYLPVKEVFAESVVDIPVFNFETEDNTYNVPFTVHNCEFVEHVAEQAMPNFIETMKKCKYLAMTFAGPGQGGHHHVNEKPAEYWIQHLENAGFKYEPEITNELKEVAKEDMQKFSPFYTSHFITRGLFFTNTKL